MKHGRLAVGCTAIVLAVLVVSCQASVPQRQSSNASAAPSASTRRAVLDRYCVTCPNERSKAAGLEPARKLTLDQLGLAHVGEEAPLWKRLSLGGGPLSFGGGDVITSIAADIADCHDLDACRIR